MVLRNSLLSAAMWLTLAAAFPRTLDAQGKPTGSISGRVTSADGLPLPGGVVRAASPSLQGTRTATTSPNGDYILAFLPPGDYEITFERTGFQKLTLSLRLALGQSSPLDATLAVASTSESVEVRAATATDFAAGSTLASSYKADLVNALPLDRSLEQTALLAPGVQSTGPQRGSGRAVMISGAPSYEGLFLLNGVVLNENLRGQAQPLFIEDAIEETTAATAAISAEFGRFTGGVVQAVTKSGGNSFSGSFRTTLTNDDWRSTTPFGEPKTDVVVPTFEVTLGGPIMKDRVWFFAAGRSAKDTAARQTQITNLGYEFENKQKRFEGKLTWAINSRHTLTGSYTKIQQDFLNNSSAGAFMDLKNLYDSSTPQDLLSLNYAGALTSKFFLEAQYSERASRTVGAGNRLTDLVGGTILFDRQRSNARYNASPFCAVCSDPEERANRNVLVKATYYLSTASTGTHKLLLGADSFSDKRFVNNIQAGSDYGVFGTTSIISGASIVPVFRADGSTYISWRPVLEPSLGNNFKTHSFFVNDGWRVNERWSFNLGLRYDKNDGVDSVGRKVVTDGALSPRLQMSLDPSGHGIWTLNAGYGRYVAGIVNNRADSGSPGGQSALIDFDYRGPEINTDPTRPLVSTEDALRTLFDWFLANGGTNRATRGSPQIPGVNTLVSTALRSPTVNEWSAGVARRLGSRALVRLDAVYRQYRDFYSQRVDLDSGRVTSARTGQVFDLGILETANLESRRYKALNAQASYHPGDRLTLGANYTLSRTHGTFVAENQNVGAVPSEAQRYPQYFDLAWALPEGDLSSDRRHRARAWLAWDAPLPAAAGRLTLSALQHLDSGLPYGAFADNLVDTRAYVPNPGYLAPPAGVDYFFTARDAFRTDTVKRTDLNLNYARRLPGVGKRTELFARFTLLNAWNGTAVQDNNNTRINLTVFTRNNRPQLQGFNPFTQTPEKGVNWDLPANFGQPISADAYQLPRTFSFSLGFRF